MKQKLYQKENNLFQGPPWLSFQENFGHQVISLGSFSGIAYDLPLGKKFVGVQKAPLALGAKFKIPKTELPNNTVFVRIEPGNITPSEVIRYKLRPVTKNSLLSGQASPKATRILDISGTEAELLATMKSKTRYNIRLAERKGVTVSRLNDADKLYELLQKTASRDKGYSPHVKHYYTKMIETLGQNDTVHVFVAEHKGDLLAAILVSFYGEVATYLHGGFDDGQKNLMAPYLCQWEAIRYAKSVGCRYYDFWGVSESDDAGDPWAGISRFKAGFGGEKVVFPGSYDLVLMPFWYNTFTFLARLKKLFRR